MKLAGGVTCSSFQPEGERVHMLKRLIILQAPNGSTVIHRSVGLIDHGRSTIHFSAIDPPAVLGRAHELSTAAQVQKGAFEASNSAGQCRKARTVRAIPSRCIAGRGLQRCTRDCIAPERIGKFRPLRIRRHVPAAWAQAPGIVHSVPVVQAAVSGQMGRIVAINRLGARSRAGPSCIAQSFLRIT